MHGKPRRTKKRPGKCSQGLLDYASLCRITIIIIIINAKLPVECSSPFNIYTHIQLWFNPSRAYSVHTAAQPPITSLLKSGMEISRNHPQHTHMKFTVSNQPLHSWPVAGYRPSIYYLLEYLMCWKGSP